MMRLLFGIFFLFSSCGKQEFPDYTNSDITAREEQKSGIYTGQLRSLNVAFTGPHEGHTKIWIRGKQFHSKVILKRGIESLRYEQYIHKNGDCPTSANDQNSNGVLSVSEVLHFTGPKLIPLDGILTSQLEGFGWFPTSSKKGSYIYSRSASIYDLMEDLRAPYLTPLNNLVKLEENEDLDLHRRTLILYAYIDNILLPVACAEIRENFDY